MSGFDKIVVLTLEPFLRTGTLAGPENQWLVLGDRGAWIEGETVYQDVWPLTFCRRKEALAKLTCSC